MASIRLSVPETASKGEVIELKALIQHPMESGYRRGPRGEEIARDIITRFECLYDGEVVFSAAYGPGISANPFVTFHTRSTQSGTLLFKWTDQDGQTWSDTAELTVT